MKEDIILKVEDVSVAYGKLQVLFGISLQIKRGQIVVMVGPNGAGKTTLLKTISGLLIPSEGTILFEGSPIHNKSPHEIVDLGIAAVPEGGGIFPFLSVEENLRMGSFIKRARSEFKKRISWVYTLFPRLEERRKQYAGTLSGGERQMLAIARSLMSKPKLILLDEPSLGLAPLIVKHIFELIRSIAEEGYTVFVVEQNAKKALQIADTAYLLESGHILMEGEKKTFLENDIIRKSYLGL